VAEISVNDFTALLLPARDIVDDVFWAVIALAILVLAAVSAYRAGRLRAAVEAGLWSGFASGLLACCMALSMIVFGMRFITADPFNVAEWAARGAGTNAPGMAAYFAFETAAGAMMDLGVLGLVMRGVLGAIGGAMGKAARPAGRLLVARHGD